MAYVITIAQRKGGAGKTTLACQLSAALMHRGLSVLGIDLDAQQSFAGWSHIRENRRCNDDLFQGVISKRAGMSLNFRGARGTVDVVIIDTAPTVDYDVRRAIKVSNLVLSPLQLSPIDLGACQPTAQAIGDARKSVRFVINRAPVRARVADEIRKQINAFKLPVAKTELGNRNAFAESMLIGAGVVETAPRSLAAQETNALVEEIFSIAGQITRAA